MKNNRRNFLKQVAGATLLPILSATSVLQRNEPGHMKLVQCQTLPGGSGKKVVWQPYNGLLSDTTPLAEGMTPRRKILSKRDMPDLSATFPDAKHAYFVRKMKIMDGDALRAIVNSK